MQLQSRRIRAHATRIMPLYLANLFLAFHYALLIYINSSFLEQFFSERSVGLIYIAGAILNLAVLINAKKILKRMSVRNLLLMLVSIESLAIIVLVGQKSALSVAAASVAHIGAIYGMVYCLDIYLESLTKDAEAGKVRTQFLTTANIMYAIAPSITGWLITGGSYRFVYVFSLLMLVPLAIIILSSFRLIYARTPARTDRTNAIASFFKNPALKNIFASRMLLDFFYSWMVIYTPIYLHQHIGLEWGEVGFVFSVMLFAFVLFEIPAGRLADSKYGEKEMLSLGFVIMGFSTFLIPFIPASASVAIWAGTLFMTRVGASLVEAMTDTYFFKHVNASHEDYIGFYRTTHPLSYIIGPLTATAALMFLPMGMIFIVLACIMMTGLRYSLALKDTK